MTTMRTKKTAPTAAPHPLVGRFFHTFKGESRVVEWQGKILAVTEMGVLVQLFEWLAGDPSCQRWCPLAAVEQWDLYDSIDWMNNRYEYVLRFAGEREGKRE